MQLGVMSDVAQPEVRFTLLYVDIYFWGRSSYVSGSIMVTLGVGIGVLE